jgi:hypothetical protein
MAPRIEIPDDLFGELQRLAIPFVDREPADVIRRLVAAAASAAARGSTSLGASTASSTGRIAGTDPVAAPSAGASAAPNLARDSSQTAGGLLASGVTIPNGLRLRLNYRGKLLPAQVREDRIWIADQPFLSPSAAAIAGAAILGFDHATLNGWWYWEYEIPNEPGQWRRLMTLRKDAEVRRRKRR